MRKFVRLAVIVAFLLTIGLTPVGASAAAPSATLQIHSQAQLQTDMSAVLTVDYSCHPDVVGAVGSLTSSMSQSGSPGGSGSAAIVATCDDRNHIASLDEAPGPFTPGTATVFLQITNTTFSTFAFLSAEVKVQ